MTSQHERIEIVNKNEVKIERHKSTKLSTKLRVERQESSRSDDFRTLSFSDSNVYHIQAWDDCGLEALQLAIACYLQTGSFEGLSTDNAIPFVGKVVGLKGHKNPLIITEVGKNWVLFAGWSDSTDVKWLLPLEPPVKKYREMTPAEIAQRLDSMLTYRNVSYRLYGVFSDSVSLERVNKDAPTDTGWLVTSLQELKDLGTWADTGEPCGIEI